MSGVSRSVRGPAVSRDPPLAPPAARRGPGAMPAALVDAFEPSLGRLFARLLPGDARAAGVGLGTELAQLRPYALGDDVRHLDAAASARTGAPHVRLHVPERALTTWIVLDISPSMAFGSADRLKADVAEGTALVFGRLAVRRGGRVGLVRVGAGEPRTLAPRGARPGMVALRAAIAAGVAGDGTHDPQALAAGLAHLRRLAREAGLLVIVSDFRGQVGWEAPLGVLRARHSVLAVEISDPSEATLPAAGRVTLADPETGEVVELDTASPPLRRRVAELEARRAAELADRLARRRVPQLSLSTSGDWLRSLGAQLR